MSSQTQHMELFKPIDIKSSSLWFDTVTDLSENILYEKKISINKNKCLLKGVKKNRWC